MPPFPPQLCAFYDPSNSCHAVHSFLFDTLSCILTLCSLCAHDSDIFVSRSAISKCLRVLFICLTSLHLGLTTRGTKLQITHDIRLTICVLPSVAITPNSHSINIPPLLHISFIISRISTAFMMQSKPLHLS